MRTILYLQIVDYTNLANGPFDLWKNLHPDPHDQAIALRSNPIQGSSSATPSGEVLLEKAVRKSVQMRAADAVGTVGVFHKTKLFVVFDKLVEKPLALEVNVVVAGASFIY